jgi:hypothetical protein
MPFSPSGSEMHDDLRGERFVDHAELTPPAQRPLKNRRRAKWGTMSNLPINVAVFFGKVDKRPSGWYWTPVSEAEIPHSGSIAGPFETKAAAVEDAHQAAISGHRGQQ